VILKTFCIVLTYKLKSRNFEPHIKILNYRMKSYLVTISVGYHNANIYLKLLLHHIKCTGLLQYMTIHITKDQDLGKTKGKGMKLLI